MKRLVYVVALLASGCLLTRDAPRQAAVCARALQHAPDTLDLLVNDQRYQIEGLREFSCRPYWYEMLKQPETP